MAKYMVLLGYDATGVYKLYDPNKNKVVVHRDILVDESKGGDWTTNATSSSNATISYKLASSINLASITVVVKLDEGKPVGTTSQPFFEFVRRSKRGRQPSIRLNPYEMTYGSTINADEGLIHFVLLAELELVSDEETLSDPR